MAGTLVTASEVVVLVLTWTIGWTLLGRAQRLDPSREPHMTNASASVIVPARNEATRLPRLLDALTHIRPHEVIVVNDNSHDDTAAIASASGALVINTSEPPPGWTGKAWACAHGARSATGDVLVFLDADVEPTAGALDALVAAVRASGGLVSAQPTHRIERLYERASGGPVLVTLLGAGTGPAPRRCWWRGPIAFGPAIAIARDAYRALDGHESSRCAVDDDLALARSARAAGVPVDALLGGELVCYRMYPDGIAQLVEGWTKNLATGARAIPPLRLAACVLWVAGALSAATALATAGPAALVLYLAFAMQVHLALRRVGRFGWLTAAFYPLALAAFVLLFAASTIATFGRRSVHWRGREIPIGNAS
jgi:4,4'-diaponeurosporenoate glycosyltransferase